MGTLANGTVVAPFANAAMRLLREDWKGKFGSKMLSEELYPILQTGIPQPDQNFQNFITVNAGEDGKLLSLIDKFGNEIYKVDEFSPNQINKGLQPVEPPGYPPPKLKPRIEWDEKTIVVGNALSGTELDAVAVDPETGAEVDGAYVYDPVSGTVMTPAGTRSLYVQFTPTDLVKYRRAMGRTTLTITATGGLLVPDISWTTPSDIGTHTALSSTQLNATATDPITFLPVAGVFVYTPPAGTFMSAGLFQDLAVHFTPTNTAVYDEADSSTGISVFAPVIGGGGSGAADATSVAFNSGVGDLIIVFVAGKSGSGSISDTNGNTYSLIAASSNAGYTISAFHATNAGPDGSVTVSTDGTDVSIGTMIAKYYSSPPTIGSSTGSVTVTSPAVSGTLSIGTVPVSLADSGVFGAWLGSQTANQSMAVGGAAPTGYSGGPGSTVTTSGKEIIWAGFSKKPFSSAQSPTKLVSANASGGDAQSVGVGFSVW